VTRLVRRDPEPSESAIRWDPANGELDAAAIEGFEAVVHLSGETLAEPHWSAAKKSRIRSSRIQSTRLLAGTLGGLTSQPNVFACASAVGFYGNRGNARLDEDSPSGTGFLAGVCRDWEAAAEAAAGAGIRVVKMRFGPVLSMAGGVLAEAVRLVRRGTAGRLGSGREYVSWIARHDAIRAIRHLLADDSLEGPVNVVSPNPVTNLEFTRILGRLLRRPTLLAVPAWLLRRKLGEMADELVLSSARVYPRKLLESGFTFRDPELEGALTGLLSE
jgi:uncharacterized protein (TIGR01777 family)